MRDAEWLMLVSLGWTAHGKSVAGVRHASAEASSMKIMEAVEGHHGTV